MALGIQFSFGWNFFYSFQSIVDINSMSVHRNQTLNGLLDYLILEYQEEKKEKKIEVPTGIH
jgi:hypothetical protein